MEGLYEPVKEDMTKRGKVGKREVKGKENGETKRWVNK
jgi:hypothetical protein